MWAAPPPLPHPPKILENCEKQCNNLKILENIRKYWKNQWNIYFLVFHIFQYSLMISKPFKSFFSIIQYARKMISPTPPPFFKILENWKMLLFHCFSDIFLYFPILSNYYIIFSISLYSRRMGSPPSHPLKISGKLEKQMW